MLLYWAKILSEGYVVSAAPDNTEIIHNVYLAQLKQLDDCPHCYIEIRRHFDPAVDYEHTIRCMLLSGPIRLGRLLTAKQRAAITALENSSETPLNDEQRIILRSLLKHKSVVMLGLGPYSWKQPPLVFGSGHDNNTIIDDKHMRGAISRIFGVSEAEAQRLREKYSSLEEAMFEENADVKALKLELAEAQHAVQGTE